MTIVLHALINTIYGQMIQSVIFSVLLDNTMKQEIKVILRIKLNVFLVCLDVSSVIIDLIIAQDVLDKTMIFQTVLQDFYFLIYI